MATKSTQRGTGKEGGGREKIESGTKKVRGKKRVHERKRREKGHTALLDLSSFQGNAGKKRMGRMGSTDVEHERQKPD